MSMKSLPEKIRFPSRIASNFPCFKSTDSSLSTCWGSVSASCAKTNSAPTNWTVESFIPAKSKRCCIMERICSLVAESLTFSARWIWNKVPPPKSTPKTGPLNKSTSAKNNTTASISSTRGFFQRELIAGHLYAFFQHTIKSSERSLARLQ